MEAEMEAGGGPVGVSSSSNDSMEKRRLGQPLLLAREEDPGVVAPDGASSPRLGMDLDFWIICSYVEMRVGTMSRGTSPPQGAHPPPSLRPPSCWCFSSSRMRVRTERITSDGSSSARLIRCIFL